MIVAGLTQAQGAVLRFSVSLIMCAGGAYCGIRHDRNVSSVSIVPELTDDGADGGEIDFGIGQYDCPLCNSLATAIEKMRAVRSSATLIFPSPL
jgi:hypothetical protein